MTYAEMDAKLKSTLRSDRYLHSKGVESVAVELAESLGADVEKARVAGLLHDLAKNMDKEKAEKLVSVLGVDEGIMENPGLWHGPVGAALLKEEYGVDDKEIYDAVFYHTVGRKNMSLLEKIIYVADLIEPGRDAYLDWSAPCREMAKKEIDEALVMITEKSIGSLFKRKMTIHPSTLDVRNEALRRIQSK